MGVRAVARAAAMAVVARGVHLVASEGGADCVEPALLAAVAAEAAVAMAGEVRVAD